MAGDESVGFYSSQVCKAGMSDGIHAAAKHKQCGADLYICICKPEYYYSRYKIGS